ncbi:MAG: hypothetical protein E7603_06085 [Ruminococcaceae bacterium]|nr:hypothetical protein [Oscillospiraceae bacterium]
MSGYLWRDAYFFNEDIMKEMNDGLCRLSGINREIAIYRFGLDGQKRHSRRDTAEHFSIPFEQIPSWESAVLRRMHLRVPTVRSRAYLRKLNEYLNYDAASKADQTGSSSENVEDGLKNTTEQAE